MCGLDPRLIRERVSPRSLLGDQDRAFLWSERDEARRIVGYASRIAELPA